MKNISIDSARNPVHSKNNLTKRILGRWQLYVFLIIPVIYIILFNYVPMLGIQLAFKKFNARLGIWGSPWVGFDQFIKFFTSYQFVRVIKNTLTLSFYGLLAGFPLPIILALVLNSIRSERYKKFIQTVTYLPYFISLVVMVGILTQMLNPRIGMIANIYSFISGNEAPDMMSNPSAFPHIYVLSGVWQSIGYNSIIYIAALSGVDPELHEAAEVDGASRFKRVIHVDLPTILPTAAIMLILNAGQIMNIGFDKAYLMQNPLNLSASEVISTYVYKVGIASSTNDFSYATAIDFFNSSINMVLITVVNFISKKLGGNSLF
ncbi:ABC transporter permease [Anaerocolumna sp. MB42-C2]|uniref:ABC transporter permease n=1 Tax=Anaerocolumna sp. MB42-C2 TaxID=3070997 RepID=UPI0027E170C6|nr:ABC transporter permease subunit [Anaerocolumna sp. MB42-C2]WMJ86700.1 ABC transporter permease subunit [Anaerocolumna sp. MB42-C2]